MSLSPRVERATGPTWGTGFSFRAYWQFGGCVGPAAGLPPRNEALPRPLSLDPHDSSAAADKGGRALSLRYRRAIAAGVPHWQARRVAAAGGRTGRTGQHAASLAV